MRLPTRKLLDRSLSGIGGLAIVLMAACLLVILAPVAVRGCGAFVFRGTVEHRRLTYERFGRGDRESLDARIETTTAARRPLFDMIAGFQTELAQMSPVERRKYAEPFRELKDTVRVLLGPLPGEGRRVLVRQQYGQTRWDRALVKLQEVLFTSEYDYSDPTRMGREILVPRAAQFRGTSLEGLFPLIESDLERMLAPRWTFYWRFLSDESVDAHFFGGIWPEVLGTIYLAIGAMLFAVPLGIIAAIYLVEYARYTPLVSILRTFVSTLAGVPSIVFGLFGLAFFIGTLRVSPSKSVLAGALTLATLVLPTVIRTSEEAIRSVPPAYKEAALALGASRWRVIVTVILPAALPGILTGVVINIGRAAGETAPIIFTAAVSMGRPIAFWQTFTESSPALSWSIYNLSSEHQAVEEIRHVQYGMVLTLLLIVALLNMAAIIIRARVSAKLKG